MKYNPNKFSQLLTPKFNLLYVFLLYVTSKFTNNKLSINKPENYINY